MDYRDLAAVRHPWYSRIDQQRMVAIVDELPLLDEEEVESEVAVPICFVVCPSCQGKGSYVDPAIDAQGLTPEELAEDPEFAENYLQDGGLYDITCAQCRGLRVVPEVDPGRCAPTLVRRVRKLITEIEKMAYDFVHEQEMGY